MNRRLTIALLISSVVGTWGLTLAVTSGYSGTRLAAKLFTIEVSSSSRQWVWQNPLPQGNTLQELSFIDTNNGFAVGARGTILKTTDGGINWEIIPAGTENDLYSVSFLSPNIRTVVGNFGAILRTTDAGSHWTIQRDRMSDVRAPSRGCVSRW